MSVSWELYEELLGGLRITSRDNAINQAVGSFATGMVDSPAYQENAKINGESVAIMASRESSIVCSIKALPGTYLHIGDMVECFGENWIVVELHVDEVGIINAEMWMCNNIIRFQNHSTAVNTRHCVVDDGMYSKKSTDPDVFVMANTYKIYITIDNETKRMFVDKRLAFGEIYSSKGEAILEVYKIIGMDVKSKNFGEGSHLMVLTVQRDVYNPESDSLADNICDIYRESEATSAPAPTGSCVIAGKDSARIGTTRKYNVTYTDPQGAVIDGVSSEWEISAPTGVTYSTSDDMCSVSIPLNPDLVGEDITIRVKDTQGIYGVYEKKVQVITVG